MIGLRTVWNQSSIFALCSLGILLISGCGGSGTINVKGKITVNGAPAEGATLLFHPTDNKDAEIATGTAKSDGSFTLISNMKEGVLPGNYIITVQWPDPAHKVSDAAKMRGDPDSAPDLLKGKFIRKDKSELKAEITSSTKELPTIDLKTK